MTSAGRHGPTPAAGVVADACGRVVCGSRSPMSSRDVSLMLLGLDSSAPWSSERRLSRVRDRHGPEALATVTRSGPSQMRLRVIAVEDIRASGSRAEAASADVGGRRAARGCGSVACGWPDCDLTAARTVL